MKRLAILVSAANAIADKPVPGVTKDVRDMKEYLRSALGGSWKWPEEICVLEDRPDDEFMGAKVDAASADYCMVVFSGHGAHEDPKDFRTSKVRMTEKEWLVKDLFPESKRHTVIVNACRTVAPVPPNVMKAELGLIKEAAVGDTPDIIRNAFFERVFAVPQGGNYIFACQVGQTAATHDTDGSPFMQALIRQARDWFNNESGFVKTQYTNDVVRRVNEALATLKTQQAIVHKDVEASGYFPFALFRGSSALYVDPTA